ncbi:MAG: heat-inducible transcription repressor HrcA [Eubacterium sp.]|nr:heat-inducible transcription repressor HrcA [Eubacterium sp.]
MTQLDERKTKILKAIIRTYLETGEPVGSRTISKYTDLNLSSATIRNEMSDLEELGYIIQPHTSAGRIPSDQGYRFYVDNLMEEKEREVTEMKNFVIERTEKMEQVLKNVVKMLATNTNYATMITAPQYQHGKLKFIQMSQVDEEQLLAVIVLEGNIVKNKIIRTDLSGMDNEQILKLNLLLNTSLNGLTLDQINLATIAKLKEQAGIHGEIVSKVLDAIAESLSEDEDLEIYTSGATNIFKYPELADSNRATELISAFEEKQQLASLVNESLTDGENTGIQVYIGSESPVQTMKDCSVVTATYELGEGMKGTIGIIGPKRMDYENVVDNLKTLKQQLDGIFRTPAKDS